MMWMFHAAVFTNLTSEHLDYHNTFVEYRDAKSMLFQSLKNDAFAVLNMRMMLIQTILLKGRRRYLSGMG